MQSASVTAMQRAVTLMRLYGCALVRGVAVYVTVFTTPVDATANTARAAFTDIQRDPQLTQILAHVRQTQTHAFTCYHFCDKTATVYCMWGTSIQSGYSVLGCTYC